MCRTAFVMCLAAAAPAAADDWPQWMGPNRDAVWAETGIVETFPVGGPKKLWAAKIGGGYAGPAVVGDKVYVPDYVKAAGDDTPRPDKINQLTGKERVLCLDAATGEEVWKYEYDCNYAVSYPAGPRCTPTVSGGKLYFLGAMGDFACLDAATGEKLWAVDFKKAYGAKTPVWGFTGHPLVYKNLVVCLVGGIGSVAVAFDKDTGKEVWKALSAPEPGYSPPTLLDLDGKPTLVLWHAKALHGLDPLTGKKWWAVPLEPKYGMSIMAPRLENGTLFAGGIGGAAVALKIGGGEPTELWRGKKNTGLYPVNMTPFLSNGTIYGVDQPGQLRAVDLATGKQLWSTFAPVLGQEKEETFGGGGSGTAFVVKNGDRYFLFNERGDLLIAALSPEKYTLIDSAPLIAPTGNAFGRKVVWTHPAFAQKKVFVRNDAEIACFNLAK